MKILVEEDFFNNWKLLRDDLVFITCINLGRIMTLSAAKNAIASERLTTWVWWRSRFLADWLRTCQFKDPDFTKCSTMSVQGLFDHLVKGIDGITELDSIDPMRIDRIRILQGEGPVSVNASLSKVKVTGFSKVKVVENHVSSKDYSWVTTIRLPKMRLEGNYHMMGRILVIPLNVSSHCTRCHQTN